MKLMRSAAQRLELRARASAVAGFRKPPLAERQSLVGAQYQPAGKASGNRSRLLPRQQRGEFARIAPRAPLLDRPLVDIGRLDLDRNSGIAQATGWRRRSARKLITAAAVSSIERRVTSMLGQLCRAHSLRENATSSATALRSIY